MTGLVQLVSYHGPAPLTPATALTAWTLDPVTLAMIAVLGAGYLVGLRRLRRHGQRWPITRTLAFVGLGLGSLVVATMSFLGVYADVLFWPRAVQNITLLMVTPLFLALGAPLTLATSAWSGNGRLSALLGSRVAKVVTFPAVTGGLLVATPFLLYFTAWYPLSLRNGLVAELLRIQLLLIGWVYFWSRLQLDPVPHTYPYLMSIWITFAEAIFDGALGLILMFGRHLVAGDYYQALGRTWGPGLRLDQVIGGGALWLIGDLAGLPFLGALMRRMMVEDRRQAAEIDRQLDEATAAQAAREGPPVGAVPGAADASASSGPELMRPWWETDPRFAHRYGRRTQGEPPR